jgi:hypothetical protein
MTEQPEALRLADWAASYSTTMHNKAAAELRRLHAVNKRLEDVTQELLEALKRLHDATWLVSRGHYNEELHDIAVSKARAVIAKSEGQA